MLNDCSGAQVIPQAYTCVDADSRLTALTPYLVPKSLRGRKVVNLGDGFILRAIERLVGRIARNRLFSTREMPSAKTIELLENSPCVILAGANQLNDRYTVWPGLSADRIRSGKLKLVPFGMGLHGEPGFTDRLSIETREILLALHEPIAYSSWRCPRTVEYLTRELPDLAPKLLMTGCPVIYDGSLLHGTPFRSETRRIAVTVTERADFWNRETTTIDFVARQFPRAERYLVLHQNYLQPRFFEQFRNRWLPGLSPQTNPYEQLRHYANRRGFKVVCPPDADTCMAFYEQFDLHIGSRLHAHLLFLSRARRSILIPVDGRAIGMAEFLGFPLCKPDEIATALDFDFEIVRHRAQEGFAIMRRFLETLPR